MQPLVPHKSLHMCTLVAMQPGASVCPGTTRTIIDHGMRTVASIACVSRSEPLTRHVDYCLTLEHCRKLLCTRVGPNSSLLHLVNPKSIASWG